MLSIPVTWHLPCTHKTKMASASDELYLFGDDFDAVLDILEEDDALGEHFEISVSNVSSSWDQMVPYWLDYGKSASWTPWIPLHAFESLKTKLKCLTLHATPRSPILTSFISSLIIKVQPSKEIVCSDCHKKYKTKGGYERHRATKHNNWTPSSLTPRTLVDIVKCALQTTIKEKAFAAGLRDELTNYQFQELEEGSQEFATIQLLYNDFVKSNNTEKFYSNFYAQIALKSTTYFRGLSRNAATLLSTSIADKMLAHVRQSKVQNSAAVSVSSALALSTWGVMLSTIFTRNFQGQILWKASTQWPFSRLGSRNRIPTHKNWYPAWIVEAYGP